MNRKITIRGTEVKVMPSHLENTPYVMELAGITLDTSSRVDTTLLRLQGEGTPA